MRLELLASITFFISLFVINAKAQDSLKIQSSTNSQPNPVVIFQMNKVGVGDRIQEGIDSLLFQKHFLSSQDSVLYVYQKHFEEIASLKSFLPEMIRSLTVLKNAGPALQKYSVDNEEGLLIFYFKDELDYWNLLTSNNF